MWFIFFSSLFILKICDAGAASCFSFSLNRNASDGSESAVQCFSNYGDSSISEKQILLNDGKANKPKQIGSVWSKSPLLPHDSFLNESMWQIEVQISSKQSGNTGETVGIWLVANKTIASKPATENWGIIEQNFSGFGLIFDAKPNQAKIAAVLNLDGLVSILTLKNRCNFPKNVLLTGREMLFSITKFDSTTIDVSVSWKIPPTDILVPLCNFSLEIPRSYGSAKWSQLYFGTFGTSSAKTLLSVDRYSSEVDTLAYRNARAQLTTVAVRAKSFSSAPSQLPKDKTPVSVNPTSNTKFNCGPLSWTRNALPKEELKRCWMAFGDSWINETLLALTQKPDKATQAKLMGSIWHREPFPHVMPAEVPHVFSSRLEWSIEVVLIASKQKGNMGDAFAIWLVANKTINSKPAPENWGIIEQDFSGFGFSLDLTPNQPRLAAVLHASGPIALNALPYRCVFKTKNMLYGQNLFLTIKKTGADEIDVTLANSTAHRLCNFSLPVAHNMAEDTSPWSPLHFGAFAATTTNALFEVKQVSSTFAKAELPNESTTTQTSVKKPVLLPIVVIVGIVIISLGVTAGFIILCVLCVRRTKRKRAEAKRKHESVSMPMVLPPPPSSKHFSTYITHGGKSYVLVQPEEVHPFIGASPSTFVHTSSPYVAQSSPRPTRLKPALGSTSPYASIAVEDLPQPATDSLLATYMRPTSQQSYSVPPDSDSPNSIDKTVENSGYSTTPEVMMNDIVERLPYDREKWEIDPKRVQLLRQIGSGAFGIVWEAELLYPASSQRLRVGVKQVRNPDDELQTKTLDAEIRLLAHVGLHENIVKLYGAITLARTEFSMILEFCEDGNLKQFLHRNAAQLKPKEGPTIIPPSFLRQLVSLAQQISGGMQFIHSKRCVHRDLAARNILLTGGGKVAKITDFGLARDIYQDGLYQSVAKTKVPWPWYAPEFLKSFIYVSRSDVWSYGVLLWEIFSLGQRPYAGTEWDAKFVEELEQGFRLEKPPFADETLYMLMATCWQWDPNERPSFKLLNSDLKKWLDNHE